MPIAGVAQSSVLSRTTRSLVSRLTLLQGRACGSYDQAQDYLKVAGSSPAFGYSYQGIIKARCVSFLFFFVFRQFEVWVVVKFCVPRVSFFAPHS